MKKRLVILLIAILVALSVEGVVLYRIYHVNEKEQKKTSTEIKNNEETTEQILEETTEEEPTTEEETTAEPETQAPETQAPAQQGENPNIDPTKPMIALTFDDGPSAKTTPILLDALEQYGAHATFFCVGQNIDGNEDIVRRAHQGGNEIANHTMTHVQLTKVDPATLENEIIGTENKIKAITNQQVVTIRPPYGSVNDEVMQYIHTPVILWSLDTLDWKTRNVQSNIESVQQNVSDGDIILMHDIHPESVEAAVQLIPWLQQQGYQLVTISELGYYRRGGLTEGPRYGYLPPN